MLNLLENLYARDHRQLSELTEDIVAGLCEYMGLETPLLRASALGCGGRRGDHLAEICHAIECSDYFAPPGSSEYLTRDRFSEASGVGLSFQDYVPLSYAQHGTGNFVSHLSVVDVLAHHGPEFARSYVLRGNRE